MPCKSWIIWLHFVISKSRDSTPYISSYQPTYVESAKLDLPDNFYTGGSILPQLPCRTNLLDPLRGKVRQKRQIDTQVVISSFARLTGPPGGASRLLIGSTHVSTQCVVRMASARHLPLSCFFFHPLLCFCRVSIVPSCASLCLPRENAIQDMSHVLSLPQDLTQVSPSPDRKFDSLEDFLLTSSLVTLGVAGGD